MNKTRLVPLIISFILGLIAVNICRFTFSYKAEYPITDIDSGWTVSINSKTHEDVSMKQFYKILDKKLERGDHIVMSRVLPDGGDIPFPIILYKSRYCALNCYLDDKLIYDFGMDDYTEGRFVGKMNHFITLPSDYAGKTFKLDMYVTEKKAFMTIDTLSLGSQPDVEGKLVHSNIQIIITGLFLLAFGLAFLCISLFFISIVPEIITLMFSSLFCMILGIWILASYNILSLLVYLPRETMVEYLSMYALVPLFYVILYRVQPIKNKRAFIPIAIISALVPLLLILLHYNFNIHIRDTLIIYHVDAIIGFSLIIFFFFRNLKRKDISSSSMTQMAGLFCFIVTQFLHLLLYNLPADKIAAPPYVERGIISIGCILFAMFQLANYLVNITQSYATQQENVSLTHLAYADGLTNLANRARSDSILENLDNSDYDYCIISIDLNGLKPVNDKFGHLAGDKYIKDFSKVLLNTFGSETFTARIGGDEFLVIIKDSSVVDVSALIGRMNSALNVMNALYPDYHRSVATGYAYRHECEGKTSHEVYLLADERMYELKRRMHEELGIHSRL